MMVIGFVMISGVLLVIYLLSGQRYADFIRPLDKKRYPLKKLFPIALFLMDAVRYSCTTKYDRKLYMKMVEIHGLKYSQFYLRIHWANKIILLLLVMLFILLIGIGAKKDEGFAVFGVSLLAAAAYFTDRELDKQIKKKRTGIQMDFPDFLNKLTLLINAGMTISKAWERIVLNNKKESPLYEELSIVLAEVNSGTSEQRAYEEFAKRCRTPEITRFVSVILQNLRKGNTEVVSVLRVFANECWEMRKNTAKRLGEEASTKLLLPMMLMFFAILLIVITPAILAMRGL